MKTLIVDIETVGENWTELDAVTQVTLTRWLYKTTNDSLEYEARLADIKAGLGFSPLTGFIVALGVYDLEREEGTVYYQADHEGVDDKQDNFHYRPRSEKQMLTEFWEGVQSYEALVTFNGRQFDWPFIYHRSVAAGVKSTLDVLKYRYLNQQAPPYQVDLQDQLTFYGAMSKRPSLHLFCRAYGITSPKISGVGGDDVAELFWQKKFRDIATYNAGDLLATAALYRRWQTYLAAPPFKIESNPIIF